MITVSDQLEVHAVKQCLNRERDICVRYPNHSIHIKSTLVKYTPAICISVWDDFK